MVFTTSGAGVADCCGSAVASSVGAGVSVGAVVEGYHTAAGVLDFVELPIPVLRAVYRVLYENAPPAAIRAACFQN